MSNLLKRLSNDGPDDVPDDGTDAIIYYSPKINHPQKHKRIPLNNLIMNTPLPYTAISLSVVGRLIFMFLLYRNRSTNSLSLLFCLLNICSSSMWIYYSVHMNDIPMISRSCIPSSLGIQHFEKCGRISQTALPKSRCFLFRPCISSGEEKQQVLPS